MKDIKDFDVNQFMPEGLATETTTTASGVGTRPSKRGVSSEQSELTKRSEVAELTVPKPPSETIEETALIVASLQTRPAEGSTPTPLSKQTAKPRQTTSTSPNEQSELDRQTAPAKSTEPIQQIEPPQPTQPTPLPRVSSRQRRASLDEYQETFLTIPKITDRQPVFVSRDVRDKIDSVVRRLGERKMSVSGFLENLARHHINLYADDLEQWKRL